MPSSAKKTTLPSHSNKLKNITGVFHHEQAQLHYNLRRYQPCEQLSQLVEQFWFVSWQLPKGKIHSQQNLPDPNFHLTIEGQQAKIICPVSKRYQYDMANHSEIIGVKFNVGAIAHLLPQNANELVDQQLCFETVFNCSADNLLAELKNCQTDTDKLTQLELFLSAYQKQASKEILQVQHWLQVLRSEQDITSVSALAAHLKVPPRTLQRNMLKYLGFSPKWLIRKYRLHQAIALLDNKEKTLTDIAYWLGYSDQAHLTKDFKEITGYTPKTYLSASKEEIDN